MYAIIFHSLFEGRPVQNLKRADHDSWLFLELGPDRDRVLYVMAEPKKREAGVRVAE